jgi:hypothetical protein
MRRSHICTLLPLVLLWACVPGGAEEASNVPSGSQAEAVSVHVTMAKHARVHFGPSLNSRTACVLDAGADVEILGRAKGFPDWYVVRFPRAGTVWVGSRALESIEGGKRFRVNRDRVRARDDSTLGANIIAELAKGEIVEAKGRVNGDWIAVYPPNAIAYIHKSVLNLPDGQNRKGVTPDEKLDQEWAEAKALYVSYKQVFDKKDFATAQTLDWAGLSATIAHIAKDHPNPSVRNEADHLASGIAPVVAIVSKYQKDHNIPPQRDVPGQPPVELPPEVSKIPPAVEPTGPGETIPGKSQPDGHELDHQKPLVNVEAPVDAYVISGLIADQANAKLGTSHVIMDQDGKVLAYLKIKPGSSVQLSEFFWNNVGIVGTREPADAKAGTDKTPVIMVEDVHLLR